MRLRNLASCLSIAILTVCVGTGCKDKDKGGTTKTSGTAADLDQRCQHLAAACGDQGKHVDKIADECKVTAKTQVAKGCTGAAIAAYRCYEAELCGKADKVWAVDDLRVLAERQGKCVDERAALATCVAKPETH